MSSVTNFTNRRCCPCLTPFADARVPRRTCHSAAIYLFSSYLVNEAGVSGRGRRAADRYPATAPLCSTRYRANRVACGAGVSMYEWEFSSNRFWTSGRLRVSRHVWRKPPGSPKRKVMIHWVILFSCSLLYLPSVVLSFVTVRRVRPPFTAGVDRQVELIRNTDRVTTVRRDPRFRRNVRKVRGCKTFRPVPKHARCTAEEVVDTLSNQASVEGKPCSVPPDRQGIVGDYGRGAENT